jgi:DNA-3-methyladenine glycosylase II
VKKRMNEPMVAGAIRHLSECDRRLGAVIERQPRCPLGRGRADLFDTLAWSIVSQQLSTRAAGTIGRRVIELTGDTRMNASRIRRQSFGALRGAGLSQAKARYLLHLAEAVDTGQVNFRSLARKHDHEVIEELVALPGIGEWTAQMFLMFALRRPDIAAPADIGLQRAMQHLYGLGDRPDTDTFLDITAAWRPYRTVGCWYLWRLVD